jgi:hypothetical protein
VQCLAPGYAYTRFGSELLGSFPDLPVQYHDCILLWLFTTCQTSDNGEVPAPSLPGGCCIGSMFTRVVRQYAYYWNTEECLWKKVAERVDTEVMPYGDPLSPEPCPDAIPASRPCTELCEDSYPAAACCDNPLP